MFIAGHACIYIYRLVRVVMYSIASLLKLEEVLLRDLGARKGNCSSFLRRYLGSFMIPSIFLHVEPILRIVI